MLRFSRVGESLCGQKKIFDETKFEGETVATFAGEKEIYIFLKKNAFIRDTKISREKL